jgi:hypothetical protein
MFSLTGWLVGWRRERHGELLIPAVNKMREEYIDLCAVTRIGA